MRAVGPGTARALSIARFDSPRARLGLVLAFIAAGAIATAIRAAIGATHFVGIDAYTYLAAGERLNAGHQLYALGPGDRLIDLHPPYWTVPLLSPPPLGVLWRPLAALPADTGMLVWQAATRSVLAATVFALVVRVPGRASLAALALALPISSEMDVANVNSFLLGGFTLAWWLFARHRVAVGPLVAVMASVKIAPIFLGWWLITQRRWSAVRWGLVAGAVVLAVSVAGSSLGAHLEYLGIAAQTATAGFSPFSLPGIAVLLGLDSAIAAWLPRILLVVGAGAVWLARGRPGLAFAISVIVVVIGSPVVNINSLALLMAILAPAAWPVEVGTRTTDAPLVSAPARLDTDAFRPMTQPSGESS